MAFLSRLLFPEKCPLCGEVLPLNSRYCKCTKLEVKSIGKDFCEHCGSNAEDCSCDIENAIRLEHITAPFVYSGVIRSDILSLKFKSRKRLARDLAHSMAIRFSEVYPDVEIDTVTFVPMTEFSMRERGFNQSELLAKNVSKAFFLNCENLLEKTVETKKQHDLTAKERMNNLDNAFRIKENASVKGKTVLLCDDIKTTGTTLYKCCNVLLENGATDIYCLCVAVSDYQPDLIF